jgi:hypothetical protein
MHREKAMRPFAFPAGVVVVLAVVEDATLATPAGELPPPQPAANNPSAATATTEARTTGRR